MKLHTSMALAALGAVVVVACGGERATPADLLTARTLGLAYLEENQLETLAKETSLVLSNLQQAAKFSVSDTNIDRLERAAELLGHYWEGDQRGDTTNPQNQ